MSQPTGHVSMTPAARAWLAQPELARLWDKLHERLERNGILIQGRITLADVGHAEREAVSLLMGRAYSGARITIALSDLDQRLRSSAAGCGLADAVAELRGRLVDKPAARSARQAERDQVWAAADDAMRTTGIVSLPWAAEWLAEARRNGTVSRLAPSRAAETMTQAVAALSRLATGPGWSRGELAERVTGTAHGLDDDTVLSRLVLRGIARSHGVEYPTDARGRRELWETAGAATDLVSSTALTYGLRPPGEEWAARNLRERSLAGAETHLTARDLRRIEWRLAPGTEVFVCENPRVIEAAVDERVQRPLVCTSGNPTTTVLALLDVLVNAGARLAYRGDFDWPGIAMANRIVRKYRARPWRMSAADYEDHVRAARDRDTPLQPLSGTPVIAEWDPELTAAMQALGVGVQEESALELLISDLEPQIDPSGL